MFRKEFPVTSYRKLTAKRFTHTLHSLYALNIFVFLRNWLVNLGLKNDDSGEEEQREAQGEALFISFCFQVIKKSSTLSNEQMELLALKMAKSRTRESHDLSLKYHSWFKSRGAQISFQTQLPTFHLPSIVFLISPHLTMSFQQNSLDWPSRLLLQLTSNTRFSATTTETKLFMMDEALDST